MDWRPVPNALTARVETEDLWGVTDLALVVGVTVATVGLALFYGKQGGPALLRVPLGFLFVFLLPGYAVTAAVFPEKNMPMTGRGSVIVGDLERVVLSVGLSVFLVPLVGLALAILSIQVTLPRLLGAIAVLTIAGAIVGAVRRLRREADRRWRPRAGAWVAAGFDYGTANRTNLLIAVLVIAAVAGVGAAITTPESGERYTEMTLLTAGEDGEPVAAGYPAEIGQGEEQPLVVELENHEGRTTEYTVVVLLQDVSSDEESVVRAATVERFDARLEPGERATFEHEVRPSFAGTDLRLTYLLYRGSVPADPSKATAYRSTQLTVDVAGENRSQDLQTDDVAPADRAHDRRWVRDRRRGRALQANDGSGHAVPAAQPRPLVMPRA